jgi:hypothetical protein
MSGTIRTYQLGVISRTGFEVAREAAHVVGEARRVPFQQRHASRVPPAYLFQPGDRHITCLNLFSTFFGIFTRLTPEINNQSASIFTHPSSQFQSKFVF